MVPPSSASHDGALTCPLTVPLGLDPRFRDVVVAGQCDGAVSQLRALAGQLSTAKVLAPPPGVSASGPPDDSWTAQSRPLVFMEAEEAYTFLRDETSEAAGGGAGTWSGEAAGDLSGNIGTGNDGGKEGDKD